ncbi:MAG: Rid family detoxifying hydrolase, partial [Proteobacteria bacterium]|nr:Rid family detoxifying hydrolase [Pseudomonadota bacterium]
VKMLRMPAYRGEHTQEGLTIAVPAIIDESVWFQVQRVLDLRPRRRRARNTQSLCVGRVWCPCGQRAYVRLARNREYIYCVTRHNRWRLIYGGKPCEYSVSHRADRIDPVIWDTVAEAITQPEILRAAMAGEDDSAVDAHRQELERCDELLRQLITNENEISRAFRRGNLSADAWNDQLKEIAADRRVLERSCDAAREQLAMAESTDYSIDLVEAQLDELQDRVRAAAPEDRKAIIESVIPGEQPFGIVLWPDGKIDIRGAIPVPAESDVAKPSSLPGQERQTSVKRLAMHPATLIIVASLAFLLACQQAAPSKATHPTAPRVEYLTSEATRSMNLPFSDAVRVGSMLYLSGQIGIQPGTLKLVPGGIAAETRQALDGIKRVLEAHGSSLDRVVKVTVMMADIAEWPAMNQVYVTYFTKHKPARSAFAASGLALNARVEIEVIATVD